MCSVLPKSAITTDSLKYYTFFTLTSEVKCTEMQTETPDSLDDSSSASSGQLVIDEECQDDYSVAKDTNFDCSSTSSNMFIVVDDDDDEPGSNEISSSIIPSQQQCPFIPAYNATENNVLLGGNHVNIANNYDHLANDLLFNCVFHEMNRSGQWNGNLHTEAFSPEQVANLEAIFTRGHHYLNPETQFQLASQLGLSPSNVEAWFQERRKIFQSSTFTTAPFSLDESSRWYNSLANQLPLSRAVPSNFHSNDPFNNYVSQHVPSQEFISSFDGPVDSSIFSYSSNLQTPSMIYSSIGTNPNSFHYTIPPHLLEDVSDDEINEGETSTVLI